MRIPKVRSGSLFPSLLAPGRRIDVALHPVIMQAWVEGVGTRKVDDLVAALGVDTGVSKNEVSRICAALTGVQLVISDSHAGLKKSISRVISGASWQRCRVHFMRNALARVPKGQAEWVAAAIRTIFAQPDAKLVRTQVETVGASLQDQLPAVAQLLRDARAELTAFAGFPLAPVRVGEAGQGGEVGARVAQNAGDQTACAA